MHDLKGKRFGRLVAIEPTEERAKTSIVWKCKCDCGKDTLASSYALVHGLKKSCGCMQQESRKKDIKGQKFGYLVALEPTDKTLNHSVVWKFKCERCGKICEAPMDAVLWSNKKSCGCLDLDNKKDQAIKMQEKCSRQDGTFVARINTDKPQANNHSGVRGVYWHKSQKAWHATLGFKGVVYSGGYHKNIADAIKDRKELEDKYYKPYLESKSEKGGNPD